MRINWDMLGMSASIACAIHCAVLPLFLTALPLFGWEILHNPWFEGGMIALAGVVGASALRHGYKRHHRRSTPAMLFGAGFACLVLKEVFHTFHVALLIPAIVLIVGAHYLNLRYTSPKAA
ncbi:MerC domain-containing protein [Dinghuibacter silviterrae]|uniref:MerC mercury resistance protein n=1 Tax=Dinghuibacter silviterrae TaxID=1539049 RepID=A0A4V3GLI2_9BACT|nr:MerC domain-containing protein [Dinghuibacter silviterrae]TDW99622.1 MerC mercury resistance protein [Dinghuibacter silviterrae]